MTSTIDTLREAVDALAPGEAEHLARVAAGLGHRAGVDRIRQFQFWVTLADVLEESAVRAGSFDGAYTGLRTAVDVLSREEADRLGRVAYSASRARFDAAEPRPGQFWQTLGLLLIERCDELDLVDQATTAVADAAYLVDDVLEGGLVDESTDGPG